MLYTYIDASVVVFCGSGTFVENCNDNGGETLLSFKRRKNRGAGTCKIGENMEKYVMPTKYMTTLIAIFVRFCLAQHSALR